MCFAPAFAQQTPPIVPKIKETPLPAPVTLPPPPAVSPDVPNRPLTAEEAAAIALHHQPGITIAQASINAAKGRVKQARSGLLPTVHGTAGYTNTALNPADLPVLNNGYQLSASLNQLIFDFNHTRDVVREAQAQQTAAGANLTRAQSDLVLQVKQAFYTYAQNIRLVSVNEANVKAAQSHLALAQARLNTGLGLPADVVRAQTAVADAIFNLNLANNNAANSRVALAELMGIDPRTPVEPADTSEPPMATNDVNALVNQAIAQRPEMKQAQANIVASRYGLSAAKTSNAPALTATAGWLQRGSDFPPGDDTLTYGVALQFTPFDAGLTAGRVEEARANLQAAQAQLDSTRLGVISDVSQAYLNLRTAEQRAVTADAEYANAQEALRLVEGRYKAGMGTFLDVLDAQTALVTADTNRVNAISAVNQARAALARAIGCMNLSQTASAKK